MDATLDSNVACADEDFSKLKVHDLKRYLKERGIQLSDGGKGKRKAELVDLCEKAAAMKQAKLDDTADYRGLEQGSIAKDWDPVNSDLMKGKPDKNVPFHSASKKDMK